LRFAWKNWRPAIIVGVSNNFAPTNEKKALHKHSRAHVLMCSLEDAWGPMNAQQRQQFAAAPNKSLSSYGEQVAQDAKDHWQANDVRWYKGGPPKTKASFGHYGCAGGFSELETPPQQQALVPMKPEKERKTEVIVIQQPPPPQTPPTPQDTDCLDAFEHVMHCSRCSRRLGRYCATLYDQKKQVAAKQQQQTQPNWWQWILIVVGIAVLAAFLVRLFQPSRPYIVRQIGFH
jgi:hypothetical protein